MKIIGHKWIASEKFVNVDWSHQMTDSVEAFIHSKIVTSPAGSIIIFSDLARSIEWVQYCREQGLPFALSTDSITETLLVHQLGAKYIIASPSKASEIQQIAQHYLFDTEILVAIESDKDIKKYAKLGIDGVIFSSAIL